MQDTETDRKRTVEMYSYRERERFEAVDRSPEHRRACSHPAFCGNLLDRAETSEISALPTYIHTDL